MASIDRCESGPSDPGPDINHDNDNGRDGWHPGLDIRDETLLALAREDRTAIVEEIPTNESSLGWYSVSCLVFNRMIGSGVFNSGGVIFHNTQSVGIAMMLWLLGAVVAISGVILYIELGLTIPRYQLGEGREKTPVVQSGGELPYLNYFLKRPKFFATCMFGISFILLFGNTATNSVAFARAVIKASGAQQTPQMIAGIAIGMNAFACLLHSVSRKWGIRLNNFLGTAKLTMVVVMVLIGFIWLGKDSSVAKVNYKSPESFDTTTSPRGVYRYAEAAVFAIFPFGGFHQANYVLAEIKHPRKNFALTSLSAVMVVVTLFITLNSLYAAIIPRETLFGSGQTPKDWGLLPEFFLKTIGTSFTSVDDETHRGKIRAICDSLRALSAFGNVIVFTFTAAKVKQEVAKEGVLPFSLFFASSYTFSLRPGRGFGFRRLPPSSRAGYQLHSSRQPAAALGLHWTVTCLLIVCVVFGISSQPQPGAEFDPAPAYYLFVTAYAYGIDVVWFSIIGIAMLCLRLNPRSRWREKSPVPHWIGTIAAFLFTVTNVFPLIGIWIPDLPSEGYLAKSEGVVRWYASQTTALCVLVASGVYWLGFRFYLYQKRVRDFVELEVERKPIFWSDPNSVSNSAPLGEGIFGFGARRRRIRRRDGTWAEELGEGRVPRGELVQIYEIVRFRWRAYNQRDVEERRRNSTMPVAAAAEPGPRPGPEMTVFHTSSLAGELAGGKEVQIGHYRVEEISPGVDTETLRMSGAVWR